MIRLALGTILFLAVALPAAAQVKPDAAPERFDVADTNKDGKVDRTEYDGFVEELVLLHDADHDDRLSRSEVAGARDPSKFDRIDADKDGFLTALEIAAFSTGDFAVMDANSDGFIDRAEAARHK
ncbi:hypothetical protein [Lysobacter panacisoli]|uniref:EF-hand domain-containing protein n=1 Tax=Lysobacter panacisoli TaxID=1255263 RepID=A0ABP9L0Z4_9GAMM|nr:hypothetical protein [Lysobacter panacisoli]